MSSIFSKIVDGTIPSYRVAEDDRHYAFLDINPVAPGHTLVIPKRETDYIFDLSDEDFAALHLFSKKVARAIRAALPCKRVGVAVMGLEVPHAHIHLVPMNTEKDMDFNAKDTAPDTEQMKYIAEMIADKFSELNA